MIFFFQYDHRFVSLKNAFIKVSFCVKKRRRKNINPDALSNSLYCRFINKRKRCHLLIKIVKSTAKNAHSFSFKQYQDLGGKNCQQEIIDKQ